MITHIARFVVERAVLGWVLAVVVAAVAASLAGLFAQQQQEAQRAAQLQLDVQRRSIELMAQTVNGSQMGAIGVLALVDADAKREALNQLAPNRAETVRLLEDIAQRHGADGAYFIGQDGIIKSSWGVGRPLTGVDVRFRPYFQNAVKGKENVYAAIGTTTGFRNLYFATPMYAGNRTDSPVIGAVVMRMGVVQLDKQIAASGDMALLLSPQDVVFASSRPDWIGHLAGAPTAERLKAIRKLKQFGNTFENKEPTLLPFALAEGRLEFEGKRFALASAAVQWNDPMGDWKLVVLEDLGRTVSTGERHWVSLGVFVTLLLIGLLLLGMLKGHYRQILASRQVEAYARAQEVSAEHKSRLAAATVRLQRAANVAELMRVFFDEAHAQFGALQGVVYLRTGEALQLAGSFACAETLPPTLALGEGLLGQCAVERRGQWIETSPDFAMIRSGLGDARPGAVLLAPVVLNDALLGVVELALLRRPDDATRDALDEMVGLLAMNVEIAGRSAHTEEMLNATLVAEQQQAAQVAFQQALLDTIPYPVFYKGADTRFIGFNRAYERCFGVTREALVGKRVLELEYLPEADRIAYQAEDEATIAALGKIEREMRIPFADGQLHDTIYFVSGFAGVDGQPGGLIGTFIDISEMKRARNELQRLSEEAARSREVLSAAPRHEGSPT